ncbi:MAG: TraB/GumN family protein [Gemmatimonadota bacterium]
MLTRLFVVALYVLWLSASSAPVSGLPAADDAPASAAPKRGFMWQVSKGGRSAYLLGTIHVGRPEFYPLSPSYLARLREADVIAVEADMSEAARVAPLVQKLAYYPDGAPGLDERLPALRPRLEKFAVREGLRPEVLWRMKPWMAANTLVVLEAERIGFSTAYATESFLFDFVRQTGKPLVQIESIEDQLRLFDAAPEAVQAAYLKQALDSIDSGANQEEVRQLVDAWSRRDSAEMERLIARFRAADGVAERFIIGKVVEGRHPHMIEAIERYVASGRLYVVAIGSLHYFGPSGLLAQLRQRGYTIAPVE